MYFFSLSTYSRTHLLFLSFIKSIILYVFLPFYNIITFNYINAYFCLILSSSSSTSRHL